MSYNAFVAPSSANKTKIISLLGPKRFNIKKTSKARKRFKFGNLGEKNKLYSKKVTDEELKKYRTHNKNIQLLWLRYQIHLLI